MLAASWLGTLPGWVTLGALLSAAWVFLRGGGSTAIGELQTANKVLERAVHDLRAQIADLTVKLAAAEARTDFVVAMAPIVRAQEAHELNAERRTTSMINLLDMIAGRLGSDPNGAGEAQAPAQG